jgi:CRP/FNR family cyclic AMP-dependent transcriptional regulator
MGLLLDSLRSVDFFADAPEESVVRFMVLGKSVDFPKGHVFWRAGTTPESLVVPVTGEAKTTTRSAEGREFIDRFLSAGQCIGLASALDGMEHPTDAEVVRAGEFFAISRPAFLKYLDAHADIRAKATTMIGVLYRRSLKEREDVALRPVPERVADFLLRHACVRQVDGARVLMHATQAELASRLGTVREVVARVFADFEQRGLIARGDNAVFVADWDGLRAESGLETGRGEPAVRASAEADARRRTVRFFLPASERMRRHDGPDEAGKCRAYLGDMSLCRERRCPGVADAGKTRHTG